MKKVHDEIIELIDREDPGPSPITREAAWRGIEAYLRDPRILQTWIEGLEISGEECQGTVRRFSRRTDFGTFCVSDTVTLYGDSEAHVHIPATDKFPESMMVIRVLEPEPGALALRFMYGQDVKEDDPLLGQRQQTYSSLDMQLAQWILSEHAKGRFSTN